MLTLILQNHEGQKVELSFQPEDTFADLRNQYPYNNGLSDSLKQLITNGTSVPEQTKIFDWVTGGAREWFSADHVENADDDCSESVTGETQTKERCAQAGLDSDLTSPCKPSPVEHGRLAICSADSDRPEFYDEILESGVENCQKYFLCDSPFGEERFSSHPPVYAGEQSAVSLLKPKNQRMWTDVKVNETLNEGKENNELRDVDSSSELSALKIFDTVEDSEHPGILCRLCGEPTANPIHLYAMTEDIENSSLADTINFCLPITVSVMDPLPKQICEECQTKLNTCHELALSSLRTEEKLSRLLREKKLCVDDDKKQHCPLCLEGLIRTVKKSGIYRKDDLKNGLYCSANAKETARTNSTERIVPTEESNVLSASRMTFPPLTDSVTQTTAILLKIKDTNENPSSLLTEEEFSVSNCSAKFNASSIPTHECTSENQDTPCNSSTNETLNFAITRELEANGNRPDLREGELICNSCRFECNALDEATEHAKICRTESWMIRCGTCEKFFSTKDEMNDHRCHEIPLDFHQPDERIDAIPTKRRKQSTRYNCFFCQKPFTRKESLKTHILTCHTEDVENSSSLKCYKCKICNEAFVRESDAEVHTSHRHVETFAASDFHVSQEFTPEEISISRLYVCEYCQRLFTLPSSLHEHRETEHNENPEYSCKSCDNSFDSHKLLTNHKNVHCHRESSNALGVKQFYVCKYCDKMFLHYSSLSGHVTQHREIVPYLCRPCNANFATYREIAVHRDIVHPYQSTVNERSKRCYNCQYCEKQFSYEVALVKHVRIHTGERPYKCSVCGKGFAQSSGLNTHVKIHSDARPYSCPECPRTFKIKGDCDNHVKRHSGDRPYKCEFCSKAFMTQHVFSQHRRIHTNDRPYKCDICGEAFRRSHVLTVHRRIHTGEKPHVCDLCPKSYRQRGDLVKHRKVQHGINSTTIAKHTFTENSCENSGDCFAKPGDRRVNSSLLLPL